MPGVEHQLAEVVSESGFVEVESLLAFIFSPVVDRDADGFGELDSQSDRLDFCE